MRFLGDRVSLSANAGFSGDGDFTIAPCSASSRVLLLGAGVTGDCNRFARKLGGISAGVFFNSDIFDSGEGRLSRTGCNAAVKSRRFILWRASLERTRMALLRRTSSRVVLGKFDAVLRFFRPYFFLSDKSEQGKCTFSCSYDEEICRLGGELMRFFS